MLDKIETVSLFNIFATNLASGFEGGWSPKTYPAESGDRYRVRIWDTHHYKVLEGILAWDQYSTYVSVNSQTDHSQALYKQVIEEFDENQLENNPIILEATERGVYRIMDGVHRLSIWFFLNKKFAAPRRFFSGLEEVENVQFSSIDQRKIKKTLRLFNQSKLPNGWSVSRGLDHGYHSWAIGGLNARGQRDPSIRLDKFASYIDLDGRNVLDLGCSSGGMLLHQANIGLGVGWDWDQRAISAAKAVASAVQKTAPEFASRFRFFRRNLDTSIESELVRQIAEYQIDMIFLLSMGSWLANWRRLFGLCVRTGLPIILETNNDEEGKHQVEFFEQMELIMTLISSDSRDDITGNHGRKTYLVEHPSQ